MNRWSSAKTAWYTKNILCTFWKDEPGFYLWISANLLIVGRLLLKRLIDLSINCLDLRLFFFQLPTESLCQRDHVRRARCEHRLPSRMFCTNSVFLPMNSLSMRIVLDCRSMQKMWPQSAFFRKQTPYVKFPFKYGSTGNECGQD